MSKVPYNKPHISYEQQVDILISRGMIVADRAYAISVLQHINYYRLGVYWHGFEADHVSHHFKQGTRFEQVVHLYEFDRELRLLVLDAIERFEVSIRTQWTYHMSAAYGSHAHMVEKAHSDAWSHTMSTLKRDIEQTDEIFIERFMQKYNDISPPIWAVSEIMSFGLLSKWYKNLRVNTLRKQIAHIYGVHPNVLQSWMQHFTVIRNNCAHHSRLWNRRFARVAAMVPNHHLLLPSSLFKTGHPLANSLIILGYLLDIISPDHTWRHQFCDLMDAYPDVPAHEMGLAECWKETAPWRSK